MYIHFKDYRVHLILSFIDKFLDTQMTLVFSYPRGKVFGVADRDIISLRCVLLLLQYTVMKTFYFIRVMANQKTRF